MAIKPFTVFDADFSSTKIQCNYEEITLCPICNHSVMPNPKYGVLVKHNAPLIPEDVRSIFCVQILFFCPNCRNTFLVKYASSCDTVPVYYTASTNVPNHVTTQKILAVYPVLSRTSEFSDALSQVSPMFVKTYHQAEIAEQQSLLEIAGCGYRKAVEYLVKDYLCRTSPADMEDIKAEFLGKSIRRIQDSRLQALAERATWIGNDETHYVRKHENLDISDMKRFISAAVHLMDSELTFEEAMSIPAE